MSHFAPSLPPMGQMGLECRKSVQLNLQLSSQCSLINRWSSLEDLFTILSPLESGTEDKCLVPVSVTCCIQPLKQSNVSQSLMTGQLDRGPQIFFRIIWSNISKIKGQRPLSQKTGQIQELYSRLNSRSGSAGSGPRS